MQFAREGRGEVESEPVHVHIQNPVAEAVHDELQHLGMPHVQRVARSRVVHVVARIIRHQPIVRAIVDASKAQRGAEMVAFRGVIVYNVEDYFDACPMQAFYHGFEFAQLLPLIAAARIARFGRKKADAVITPIVAQAVIEEVFVIQKRMHRHQFHGRNP